MKLIMTFRNAALLQTLIFCSVSCTSAPGKTASKMHLVEIRQMQFEPAALHVQKGDSVTFTNKDMVVHDVTEANGEALSSSPLSTDQSFSMEVSQSFDYFCSLHPVMKGKISVQ